MATYIELYTAGICSMLSGQGAAMQSLMAILPNTIAGEAIDTWPAAKQSSQDDRSGVLSTMRVRQLLRGAESTSWLLIRMLDKEASGLRYYCMVQGSPDSEDRYAQPLSVFACLLKQLMSLSSLCLAVRMYFGPRFSDQSCVSGNAWAMLKTAFDLGGLASPLTRRSLHWLRTDSKEIAHPETMNAVLFARV